MTMSSERFQEIAKQTIQNALKQKRARDEQKSAFEAEGPLKKGIRALHGGIESLRDAPGIGGFIPEEETIQKTFKGASDFVPGAVVGEEIASGIAGLQDREVTGAITGDKLGEGASLRGKKLAGDVVSGALTFAGAPAVRGLAKLAPKLPKLGKFVGTVSEGAVLGGAEAAREGEDVGEGALTGGSISGAFNRVGSAFDLAKNLPESIIRNVLGQSKKQLRKELSSKSKPLTKKFMDAGRDGRSVGTSESLISGAQKEIDTVDTQILGELKSVSKNPITTQQGLFEEVSALPEFTEAQLGSPEIVELIKNLVPRTKQLLSKENLTIEDINEIRIRVAKKVGDSGFLADTTTENVANLRAISTSLGNRVKKEAPGTGKLFDEMSTEIRIRDLLVDQSAGDLKKSPIGLTEILAILGGVTGGIGPALGGLGVIAGKKALESTMVKTKAAELLPKLGRARRIVAPSFRRGAIRKAE